MAIFEIACSVGLFLIFVRLPMMEEILSSVVLLLVSFWFFGSVRCPFCAGRPMWFMASRMDVGAFNPWVMEHCPICRDTGDVRPISSPLFSAYRGV